MRAPFPRGTDNILPAYLIRRSRLFSPYTLIDWDQSAPDLDMLLEDLEKISVARYLIRFGRPL